MVDKDSPLLRVEGIEKSFAAIHALKGVNMEIVGGEVHAIVGENGAGKSTLMKILSGAHVADKGKLTLAGKPYAPQGPAAARLLGIAMIYQELALAPHLSVEENVLLGLESGYFTFGTGDRAKVQSCLRDLGHGELDPRQKAGELNTGMQQVVEIARALYSGAKVIILDEPTSSLGEKDVQALFAMTNKLKATGVALVYISHFLEEVMTIADRFTVLRDGASIATGLVKEIQMEDLVRLMVGRDINEVYPGKNKVIGEVIYRTEGVRGPTLHSSLDLELRSGEIIGCAGLMGSGRSELIRGLFGLQSLSDGLIELTQSGQCVKARYVSAKLSLKSGVNFLSENRKEEGLALAMSITGNITLSRLKGYATWGWLSSSKERAAGQKWSKALGVKCANAEQSTSALSGGNQQKVALARLLHDESQVLLLDEPTRGVDVGSKSEIYKLIQELAAQGKTIIIVSSYLPELFGLCHRLLVMHKGKASQIFSTDDWSHQQVMAVATAGETKEGG